MAAESTTAPTAPAAPAAARRFTWKRAVLAVVLAALAYGAWWTHELVYGKPSIDLFFERAFIKLALQQPQLLTQIGLLESIGLNFHNSRLDDGSDEFQRDLLEQQKAEMEILRSYDRASFTPQQKLSADIADYFFDENVRGERFRLYNYPLNQLFGAQNEQPAFMINIHPVRTLADAKRYNDRLLAFRTYYEQVLAGLKTRANRAIAPPRFVVEKVLEEMKGFIAPEPREHPLYVNLRDKLAKVAGVEEADRAAVLQATAEAIKHSVYPAYRALIAYEEGALPHATTDDGVWKFPDGAAFYAYRVRSSTTTDLTPEQVHQLGLAEVARIEGEFRVALAAAGLGGTKTVGQHLADLRLDPRQRYPDNTPATREQVLADYQKILDEVNERIGAVFPTRPKSGLTVKAVEPFREKTAAGAFYSPGTLDGARKGAFFVNLRNVPEEVPKFTMKTIAYHEGIPGHYFQIAIAHGLTGLPTFRRILPFTAYGEGWALYAEKLAFEQGLYANDPFGNLGRLQWELFRAARLVVDTGIHYKRWTREQAIQYMEGTTGVSHGEVVSEVERYIVLPGQACAYKIGELKILELREKARKALGARFDLGKFHDVVLRNGSLPLAVLERVVDEYIAASKA